MQRRTSLAVIACASAATLLAGCGSSSSGGATGSGTNDSSQSPSQELTSSVSALGKASTLTTTVKLGATASQISALAASGGSNITSTEANTIAGAEIAVEVVAPSGKTLSDVTGSGSSGSAVDITVSDNGTNYLSIRSLNKTLYVQADLKDLFNALGQGSTYAGLQSQVAELPGFLQALVAGKWVSLPQSAATGLTGTSSGSSASPEQEKALLSGLKNILSKDVTVTRESSGSTDDLALSANSRSLVTDFVSTVTAAVPAAAAELGGANLSNVPSQNIGLGAQVTNGALSQLSIDLGQFDPKGKAHLPLELNFSQSGAAISAPSGAVAVNTQELTELLGGLTGGLGTGSG
jgi:hypothetical protein